MSDDLSANKPEQAGDDMGTVVLMLSLYLIVLAFFILLNVISESSQSRFKMVVESVADSFSYRTLGQNMLDQDTTTMDIPAFDHVAKDIKGIIEAYLALERFRFFHEADRIHVYIPTAEFFPEGDLKIAPKMASFMDDLGALLTAPHYNVLIKSEINVKAFGGGIYTPAELAGRRATLLTRALIDRGVAPSLLAASTEAGTQDDVEFFFELIELGDGATGDAAGNQLNSIYNQLGGAR